MTDCMTEQEIDALCEALPTIAGMVQIKCSRDAASTIRQALTAIRQLQQPWRGIESAPDNVDECALWCTDMCSLGRGKLEPKGYTIGRIVDGTPYGNGLNGDWTFTKWMPLPTPPETDR